MTSKAFDNVVKLNDLVSVKDFGAKGDGVTDDTAAINAAINYWAPFQTFVTNGGRVYFPTGRYKITSTINLTGKHGIFLQGSGVHATEIFATGDYPVFESINTASEPWVDGHIVDMTIRGGGYTNANSHGIYTVFTNGCTVNNITLYSCKYGLNINHAWQYHIENVDIHGGGVDRCDIGVYMGPTTLANIDNAITASNITVKDCITAGVRIINGQGSKFVNCESGATPIGWYIGEPSSGSVACEWLHFTNCLADTTTNTGWRLIKGAAARLGQMQFANCWSGNNTDTLAQGLLYIDGGEDIVFTGSQFIRSTNNGIQLISCNRIIFAGYILTGFNQSNSAKTGVLLNNTFRCVFYGQHTTLNGFTGSDVLETGTSNINYISVTNSNGAQIIGADSRHVADGIVISSGASIINTFAASSGSASILLKNSTPITYSIALRQTDDFVIAEGATEKLVIGATTGHFFPGGNNTQQLGAAGNKWSEIFAGNGTINVSDAATKQNVRNLSEAEQRVAARIKQLIKIYRFNDAVQLKGDSARLHAGVVAQEVADAFEAEGLNATNYGLFCYDEWTQRVDSESGQITRQAGASYGIRYNELLAFVIAAL
jgi:hypothetical protein